MEANRPCVALPDQMHMEIIDKLHHEVNELTNLLHATARESISVQGRLKNALQENKQHELRERRARAALRAAYRQLGLYDKICISFPSIKDEIPSPGLLSTAIFDLRWSTTSRIEQLTRQVGEQARHEAFKWNGALEWDEEEGWR